MIFRCSPVSFWAINLEPVEKTLGLVNAYGLGTVLAVMNVFCLIGLITWVLKTCQREKFAMMELMNNMSASISQLAAAVSVVTESVKGLSEESRQRFESVKEANRFQREEHKEIMQISQQILIAASKGAS